MVSLAIWLVSACIVVTFGVAALWCALLGVVWVLGGIGEIVGGALRALGWNGK